MGGEGAIAMLSESMMWRNSLAGMGHGVGMHRAKGESFDCDVWGITIAMGLWEDEEQEDRTESKFVDEPA